LAGRFLCDAVGKRLTSSLGYTLLYDDRDNRVRPTRGQSIGISQDFAGLGGDVKYIKTRLNADKFWRVGGSGFIFSLAAEGGYIHPLENRNIPFVDDVRLTDRFYLGEPQIRGFDIRGVGPRVQRVFFQGEVVNGVAVNAPQLGKSQIQDDAIGGRAYYLGRAELQIPLGSGAKELGLRPSVFVDVGAVFDITRPLLQTVPQRFVNADGTQGGPLFYTVTGTTLGTSTDPLNADGSARVPALQFEERFFGDSMKPRLSVGFGVNWNSPFGPFRIDIAKALLKEKGDDTKLFTFNVGTQF
jgi:outer membrane protein insertion porin family